jgi:hypothetical protein
MYTQEFHTIIMFVTISLQRTFLTVCQYAHDLFICIKFHMPSFNGTSLIAIKPNAQETFTPLLYCNFKFYTQ